MLEIKHTGLEVEMETVDGVRVPTALLTYTEQLADAANRVHFIGVVEEQNPDFKQTVYSTLSAQMQNTLLEKFSSGNGRYRMTGAFVVSDERQQVINHGCGRLVWILPNPERNHSGRQMVEDQHDLQPITCAECATKAIVTAGTTDKDWTRVQRGNLAAQDLNGTITADKIGDMENIKYERFYCGTCAKKLGIVR